MTGIFKANNPSGNAILFLYALALKLPMFLYEQQPQLQPSDGFLYKAILLFIAPIANAIPFAYSIFSFVLIFSQAIIFNKIVNTQKLHKQTNYLTGMSYLLITSLFPAWFCLSAPLIVNTLMIWIWARLCTLYTNPNPKATIFNIGFVTGVSAFLYFPSIAFLVLIMAAIAIARPFKLQEWLIGLVGIITPVYLFWAWLYLSNKINTFKFAGLHFSAPQFYGNNWAYIALIAVAIVTILGIFFTNANMRRQLLQTRKSWQLLFLYTMVAAIIPFINAGNNFSYWILLALPLSPIIASAFFYPLKKIVPLFIHWLMIGLYVFINFFLKK